MVNDNRNKGNAQGSAAELCGWKTADIVRRRISCLPGRVPEFSGMRSGILGWSAGLYRTDIPDKKTSWSETGHRFPVKKLIRDENRFVWNNFHQVSCIRYHTKFREKKWQGGLSSRSLLPVGGEKRLPCLFCCIYLSLIVYIMIDTLVLMKRMMNMKIKNGEEIRERMNPGKE